MFGKMMFKDIAIHSVYANKEDITEAASIASKLDGISTHPYLIPAAREYLSDKHTVACLIDYPYGLSDTKIRQSEIIQAVRKGANCIDIVINQNHLFHSLDKLVYQDLETVCKICDQKNMLVRPMIEFKILKDDFIENLLITLHRNGIKNLFVSTGLVQDSTGDTILYCLEAKKYGLNPIFNGKFWLDSHIKNVISANISGIRSHSVKMCEQLLVGV